MTATMPKQSAPGAPPQNGAGAAAARPTIDAFRLELLHPHPANRKRFNQAELAALAEDIKSNGQLTPALVRRLPDGLLQLLAGERRWRAAKLAGLETLLCIVREVSDLHALSMLARENNQREDVHPMEEAELYEAFTKMDSLTQERIAKLVGRDPHYVRDRLQLLKLIPAARKLFLADRFTVKHAIILARLSKEHQERAIGDDQGEGVGRHLTGLFTTDFALFDREAEDSRKAVSVGEFQKWVDEHCRLRTEDPLLPALFPETAEALEEAKAEHVKLVHITYDHMPAHDAKDPKIRTIGHSHWKRADGEPILGHGYDPDAGKKSKTCDKSVLGFVAAGPDRGRAFLVCIDKKGCKVHWAEEQKEAAKRAKSLRGETQGSTAANAERAAKENAKLDARRAEEDRWEKAHPKILEAIAERIRRMPTGATTALGEFLLDEFANESWAYDQARRAKDGLKAMPAGKSAEDLVRHLAFYFAYRALDDTVQPDDIQTCCKIFGVDAAAIVDQVSPKPMPEKKAEAKPAKKLAGDARRAQAAKAKRKK